MSDEQEKDEVADTLKSIFFEAVGAQDDSLIRSICHRNLDPEELIKSRDKIGTKNYLEYHAILAEHGANPNVLMFEAIRSGSLEVLEKAIDKGADIHAIKDGAPAIVWANTFFEENVFKYLSAQEGINSKDYAGKSFLMQAVEFACGFMIQDREQQQILKRISFLINRGDDPLEKDSNGNFPLKVAKESIGSSDNIFRLSALKLLVDGVKRPLVSGDMVGDIPEYTMKVRIKTPDQ